MTTLNQFIQDQAQQNKSKLNESSLCEDKKFYHKNNINTFCYGSSPLPLFYLFIIDRYDSLRSAAKSKQPSLPV